MSSLMRPFPSPRAAIAESTIHSRRVRPRSHRYAVNIRSGTRSSTSGDAQAYTDASGWYCSRQEAARTSRPRLFFEHAHLFVDQLVDRIPRANEGGIGDEREEARREVRDEAAHRLQVVGIPLRAQVMRHAQRTHDQVFREHTTPALLARLELLQGEKSSMVEGRGDRRGA